MTKNLPRRPEQFADWTVRFDGEVVGFQGQTSNPVEIDKLILALTVHRDLLAQTPLPEPPQ